jgi:hypothetical protein
MTLAMSSELDTCHNDKRLILTPLNNGNVRVVVYDVRVPTTRETVIVDLKELRYAVRYIRPHSLEIQEAPDA